VSPRRRRDGRSADELIRDIHEALVDAEDHILSVGVDEFMEDRVLRGLARDVLNRVRTAVLDLDRGTLGRMPEFVASDIAELRNLAVYEYGLEADELVYRTLRNAVPQWRSGIDRARHRSGSGGGSQRRVSGR
jgi:uncharacterized protein with HEPN domain